MAEQDVNIGSEEDENVVYFLQTMKTIPTTGRHITRSFRLKSLQVKNGNNYSAIGRGLKRRLLA
jgi:hypothetical protein